MIVVGILMFAAVTAVLYVWGLKKSLNQREDLSRNLMSACGARVVKYLKRHETITQAEIGDLIDGMTIGQFWSRNKIKVQSGKIISGQVIEFLMDQQYIESAGNHRYRLKK